MSVKDRLRRKVKSFRESGIECPDEESLLVPMTEATDTGRGNPTLVRATVTLPPLPADAGAFSQRRK